MNLAQAYEAEFSSITLKDPDLEGKFTLDTSVDANNHEIILFSGKIPIGFAVIGKIDSRFDIGEFYILPKFRKLGAGKFFAHEIISRYPGPWQARQIAGADQATSFWRAVIHEFTAGQYLEEIVDDLYWGKVTKQIFESP